MWAGGKSLNGDSPYFLAVSPGWFETMKIPVLAGRDFRAQDATPRVVIVNEAFASHYFDGQGAVGRALGRTSKQGMFEAEIIGMVRDTRYREPREEMRPTVFSPLRYASKDAQTVTVFNTGDWGTFLCGRRTGIR